VATRQLHAQRPAAAQRQNHQNRLRSRQLHRAIPRLLPHRRHSRHSARPQHHLLRNRRRYRSHPAPASRGHLRRCHALDSQRRRNRHVRRLILQRIRSVGAAFDSSFAPEESFHPADGQLLVGSQSRLSIRDRRHGRVHGPQRVRAAVQASHLHTHAPTRMPCLFSYVLLAAAL
jgi:hypothetical protein